MLTLFTDCPSDHHDPGDAVPHGHQEEALQRPQIPDQVGRQKVDFHFYLTMNPPRTKWYICLRKLLTFGRHHASLPSNSCLHAGVRARWAGWAPPSPPPSRPPTASPSTSPSPASPGAHIRIIIIIEVEGWQYITTPGPPAPRPRPWPRCLAASRCAAPRTRTSPASSDTDTASEQ